MCQNAGILENTGQGSKIIPMQEGSQVHCLSKDEEAFRSVVPGVFEFFELFIR